jgi:hypothetical protein
MPNSDSPSEKILGEAAREVGHLKKLALATLSALAALIAVVNTYADERVCIGVFETQQASGKYPKTISLGVCVLDNLPKAEFDKIVKACGRPYDTTHREPPANAHACRALTVATRSPYRTWVVEKVISVRPTTFEESRRAAEEFLKEEGLL